jgi:putative DNA primase/helicase
MKIDTKSLLGRVNIVDVVQRYVPLKKRGGEFYGVCPFHDDEKESLQVNERKQIFKCFACGDDRIGGDAIQFLTLLGRTFHEACEEINGGTIDREIEIDPVASKKYDSGPVWVPAPQPWPEIPNGFRHYSMGEPSKIWAYNDADGSVVGYVARFDLDDGSKQVIPLIYAKSDSNPNNQWRWLGLPAPRPLYNLHHLRNNPMATVVVVEGEKTADAVFMELDPEQYVATTWIGGANGIKNANWEPLKGRNIILWPDHDTEQKYGDTHPKSGEIKPWFEQPGNHAMIQINEFLKNESDSIKWINVPDEYPHKWDAADRDDWDPESMVGFMNENLIDVPLVPVVDSMPSRPAQSLIDVAKEHGAEIIEKPVKIDKSNPPLPPKKKPDSISGKFTGDHFRFLGYDTDENSRLVYYFFSFDAKSVIKLSPSAMSKANLMMLAPINYWEDKFGGSGRQRLNIDAAQQYLMMASHKVGVFREKYIRGRGAWIDDDKFLIHTGEHLLVENQKLPLKGFKSKFVYQIGETLGIGIQDPLPSSTASQLIDHLKWLEWDRGVNAYLLAGWCVIAPFCGVLNWRPHIWITGPSGSGKSWVMDHVLKRMMGEVAIVVQGHTTEAGIRGMLQSDARPVLFDESDVENYSDRERVQSVLSLARSASYKDGGATVKGTQGGSAKSFQIRSCFAMSSIGLQLNQQSDRSRFSILGLRSFEKLKTKDDFAQYELKFNEVFTDDFVHSLQARTIQLMPVILKNSKVFADAASHLIGNRRIGDQIGGMLAGAYSLRSRNEITYDDALEWCKKRDWDDEKGLEQTKDEFQLFALITSYVVKMESQQGFLERTIGELIMFASGKQSDAAFYKDFAADRLRRIGIIVRDDDFLIANNAPGIKEILKNSPWQRGHNKVLERLPNAEKMDPRLFVPGLNSRSVSLKYDLLMEGLKKDSEN